MHNFFTCSLMGCKGHYNYVKLDFSISAACNQKSYDDLFCVFFINCCLGKFLAKSHRHKVPTIYISHSHPGFCGTLGFFQRIIGVH